MIGHPNRRCGWSIRLVAYGCMLLDAQLRRSQMDAACKRLGQRVQRQELSQHNLVLGSSYRAVSRGNGLIGLAVERCTPLRDVMSSARGQ